MSLPYVAVRALGSVQAYGALLFGAASAGVVASMATARRYGEPWRDVALLPIGVVAALVGGHVWDVVAYRWDEHDASLWAQLYNGQSLFGALLGVALFTTIVVSLRKRDLSLWADIVAMGCLVAMVIGRIGCALVHDHPGIETDSIFGVDTPSYGWTGYAMYSTAPPTIRIHDLGVDELLLLVPLAVVAYVLLRVRLRAGAMAAIVAITYASIRFPLDLLRTRRTEPLHAGLTSGQWGALALAAVAIYGLIRVQRAGRVAPLAAETKPVELPEARLI